MQATNILQKSVLTLAIALFSFYGLSQEGTQKQTKKR
jgi:hypothetical protein